MSERHGVVYTDGACSKNGYPGACAGSGVWWGFGDPYNFCCSPLGRQTNNNAEIRAAIVAVQQAIDRQFTSLTIYTDSQFLINCMVYRVPIWQANGWRKSGGGLVANRVELNELAEVIRESNIDVMFEFIPGHAGIVGNIEADKLAKQAVTDALNNEPCGCCGGPLI